MKIMVIPKNKDEIANTLLYADAYLIGLNGLSVNMPTYFSELELFELIKYVQDNKKEIFIALNKNMHNKDIPYLKETMFKLDKALVNGISYYDIAVINIKKENHLNIDLIWNQEHLTNNYITSNYWFDHGSKYTMLSSEITLEEVSEIKESGKAKMILPVFGYLPMMVSKRHLVRNYLDTFKIEDNSNVYYLEHQSELYPIIDDTVGSLIYSSRILNGIRATIDLKMDYILLNSYLVDSKTFYRVLKMFKEVNNTNVDELESEIDSLLKTDRGFLYKETFYKVKKDA